MRAGWRLCGLIVWLAATPARAEPAREVAVALAWRADGCFDTAGLYDAVRSRRRPVREATSADAIVSGRAEIRPGGGWRVELVVADRRGAILGRRSLEVAEDGCAPLRDHVALVVAMLVDSSVVEGAAPAASPPPRPDIRHDDPRRGDAGAALVGEIGRLPGDELGLGAAFGLAGPGRWRGEIGLFAFAEAHAGDGTGETSIRWVSGALSGCRGTRGRLGWLRESVCAGLEVGIMSAEGSGFTRNQRDRKLLVDVVLEARAEIDLFGPSFLMGALGGRLAALRPRFGYQDEAGEFQPLYEPSAVGLAMEIGLGAHFP